MKKLLTVLLSLTFIISVIAFAKKVAPPVFAEQKIITVSTDEEFVNALSGMTADSDLLLYLTNNITLTARVQLNGRVQIISEESAQIRLGAGGYIDLKNGVNAVFKNLSIIKTLENEENQSILFRDNSKQGSSYFYNCNLVVEEGAIGVALRSISINGVFYLDNTIITGGSVSCLKGSLYLSGNTQIGAVDANVLVYDFRECEIIATPSIENFSTADKVVLDISKKPVYWKGTSEDTQKFDVNIYYTLDGSDPVTSSTRILFRKTQPISLIVDRQIKATVAGEGICYCIGVQEFVYDVNKDKTPADVTSVTPAEELRIRCSSNLTIEDLPEAVEVVLSDGRKVFALANWDISSVNVNKEGEYTVYAQLTPPYFINNPNNLKGEIKIIVYYNEIEDFIFTAKAPMQVGKDTNKRDYVVGEFSAKGGDEKDYIYSLAVGDGDSDNDKFYISENQLKLKGQLPAGVYSVLVCVTSGGKTAHQIISLEVLNMAYEKKVVLNPYEGIDWQNINFVQSALHNHTWYSSAQFEETEHKDSASDMPDDRIAYYKSLGFGAVVITEHDYVTLDYVGGAFKDQSIVTLYGNELSKNYHVLYYGLQPYYDQRGKGVGVSNGFNGNAENVAKMNGNGIIYFAHPNRSTKDKDYWYNLFEQFNVVYGMEVFNAGQAQRNYSEDLWDYILTKSMPQRAIWGSASDDAHGNSSASTGWQVLLLTDEQMNAQGLLDCLKKGNSFLSTVCVNPETDDNIRYNDVKDEIPYFTSVTVDENNSTVSVTAERYVKLEWVSADGKVVGTNPTLDLNKTYGIEKYVRCRIYGTSGMSHTQPIGIADGDKLYEGEPEEDLPVIPELPNSSNSSSSSQNDSSNSQNNATSSSDDERNQGCGSVLGGFSLQLPLLLQTALVSVYIIKKGWREND